MKIQSINTNNYSFQARRKEIRRADDIVRNVNKNFPAFSTTYAEEFWFYLKKFKKGYTDKRIYNKHKELGEIRKNLNTKDMEETLFKKVKEKKVGNCGEKSYLTLGALSANGIKNFTRRYDVGIKWSATDLRTGERVFEDIQDFDHNIVVSTMTNEKPKRNNDLIVIDGWLNKAMSYSEAQAKYKAMIKEDFLSETQQTAIIKFIDASKKDYGLLGKKLPYDFDINNYEFEHNIVFYIPPKTRYHIISDEFDKLGEIVTEKYPELVLA